MAIDLSTLNDQQREAVLHRTGPLLILAGAGTGKTRVLTHRIAHLIDQGIAPWRILAITFTNKAAAEMRERVADLVGPAASDIWISTFHSACVRILRREIERMGYARNFTILDSADQQAVVKDCCKQLGLNDKQFQAGAVQHAISEAKNELQTPEQFASRHKDFYGAKVAEIYKLYQQRLRTNNALDFDDLIMITVRLFEQHPDVLEYYQRKFEHVLVDEYQDTNHTQYVLVRHLAALHRNLCVVGDDDQGIYSWRGADIQNILDFEKDYRDTCVIKLEQNYRSTQNILDAAFHVVSNNLDRKEKRLWTSEGGGQPIVHYQASSEHDEAHYAVSEMQRLLGQGMRYGDFAILYRTHAQSRALEEVLISRGIPYGIVGGLKFYERKEIKDVLAYLRLIDNPADILSFRRAVGVPKRGIGPATLDRLVEYAGQTGLPILEVAQRSSGAGLTRAAAAKVETFAAMVLELRRRSESLSVGELVDAVANETGLMKELKAEGELEAMARVENIQELKTVAMAFEPPTGEEYEGLSLLGHFLATVSLVADADTVENGQDKVTLMTLHSAKGLEFPVVFLIGMEEGVFPHSRSIGDDLGLQEERRLCYVGMTRARGRLYLTNAWSRSLYGQTNYNSPSRFLTEVPPVLLEKVAPPSIGAARTTQRTRYTSDDDGFSPAIGSPGWGQRQRSSEPAWESPPKQGDEPSAWGQTRGDYDAAPAWGQTRGDFDTAPAWGQTRTPATAHHSFEPGDAVRHGKFGLGTVLSIDGDNVRVFFNAVGEKTLVASYLQPYND